MIVKGGVSGRNYSEKDIFDDLYLEMKAEPLFNDADELVVPVRKKGGAHFRRIGNASFGTQIGRAENDPTHNACVKYLNDELSSLLNKRVTISSYIFAEDGSFEEQVFFSTLPHTQYSWFMESDARVAFDDHKYIQPDLAGRDSSLFFPRASRPNIIIEVIRTHAPEQETFKRLYELSLANTVVAFYFVSVGKSSKLNNFRRDAGVGKLRVSHYIINGEVYKNGQSFYSRRQNESLEEWYVRLSVKYFEPAKKSA